jgi:eukaryotic-like serine/threonine-protein kinase
MSAPHQQESAIFDAAMELPPERRPAYLEEACGGDTALRRRVESLLQACDSQCLFLDSPARDVAAGQTVAFSVSEKPGDIIGRYKLLEQIGEGGCGVVYVAEQTQPVRRRVALKIIKLGMDTRSVIARFEAERQALAMMDHPNIAKVLDAGATEAGRPYFVMELVRGLKITEFCDEKKLSPPARLDLFIKVCQAIQHAHQKGIIHRDIKPSNILVTVNDGVPVPKVIDFGIAKATAGQQLTDKTIYTAFEQFIGTPAYMSPEQAVLTSLDIDTRSDIYALGVLLYELLTGKTPFDGKELLAIGLDEMRRTIREQEPPRPSTRLSTLPGRELSTTAQRRSLDAPKLVSELRGDLDWIVMKALEKDRARRYETANGLAMDIQRHLNHEPVVACPPSKLYLLQKAVRRNKLAVTVVAGIVVVLTIATAISTWQAACASRAEKAAEAEKDSAEAVLKFLRSWRERLDGDASHAFAPHADDQCE